MGPWNLKPICPVNLQIWKEKVRDLKTEPGGTPNIYRGQVNWEKPVKETEKGQAVKVGGESRKSDGCQEEKEFQEKGKLNDVLYCLSVD